MIAALGAYISWLFLLRQMNSLHLLLPPEHCPFPAIAKHLLQELQDRLQER